MIGLRYIDMDKFKPDIDRPLAVPDTRAMIEIKVRPRYHILLGVIIHHVANVFRDPWP